MTVTLGILVADGGAVLHFRELTRPQRDSLVGLLSSEAECSRHGTFDSHPRPTSLPRAQGTKA
jgi:hypothetical protein